MRFKLVFIELSLACTLFYLSNGSTGGRYTRQEKEFIIKELESIGRTYTYNIWHVISESHGKKVKDKVPGFSKARSAQALQHYMYNAMVVNKGNGFPESVKQLYFTKIGKSYSAEEEDFMNAELRSYHGSLYNWKTWVEIKAKHDEMRKSGCTGFTYKRTVTALRTHFTKVMMRNGRVDEVLMQRYPSKLKPERGKKRTDKIMKGFADGIVQNEEDEVWVDEFGVDHTLFWEPRAGADNGIFKSDSPYEVRTFETSP